MYKIICPSCGHEFGVSGEEFFECPNCQFAMRLDTEHDFVIDFEDCVLESTLLFKEAQGLDDASLEDEIVTDLAVNDYMRGSFGIAVEMDKLGYMSAETRRMAEGTYVLMHSKKNFGYEQ